MQALRSFLSIFPRTLSALLHWVRTSRYAPLVVTLLCAAAFVLAQRAGYHTPYVPTTPSNVMELEKGWTPPPDGAMLTLYVLPYLRLLVLLGGILYHVAILRAYPNARKMIWPTWLMCGLLAVWALTGLLYNQWEEKQINWSGEVISSTAFLVQIGLMVGLLLSPPLMLIYYSRCKIMEKYVMRSFLMPLLFCFTAFCTLWIVMDLMDNLQDFSKNKISKGQIVLFYIKLIPFIYVTVAPITLLLATVYTLGRMSRTNELISMLGTGKSLFQVLRPIYLTAVYAAFLGMVANYHWAPVSAGNKEALLDDSRGSMRANVLMQGLMYRNQEDRRTWFVGIVPTSLRNEKMRRIEIREEDEQGNLVSAYFANSAFWWPQARTWSIYNGIEVKFENGRVTSLQYFDFDGFGYNRKDFEGWSETPWILLSGALTPDYLGVPDLISYIVGNSSYGQQKLAPYWTHFFYRFAVPWQCLAVVIFAAPLSVVFSRRGLVGGIASAVLMFFLMIFLDNLFLNLGKGGRLPAVLAVWMPHLVVSAIGLYLFSCRSRNKDFPSLSPKALWRGLFQGTARQEVKPA